MAGNITTINPTTFTNNGTVQASSGANLTFTSAATNAAGGAVGVSGGGTLTLNGSAFTNNGAFTVNGSTLTLNNSTLTNNSTVAVADGPLNLNSSTVIGGTLNVTGAAGSLNLISGTSFLDGVATSVPAVNITNASLQLRGGSLSGNINLFNGANLDLLGPTAPTLNTASITFGNTGTNTTASSLFLEGVSGGVTPVYTIGSGTTLSGRIGQIGDARLNGNARTLVNNGTITSNVVGNTTTINPTNFTNNGTIVSTAGATVSLSPSARPINTGTIRTDALSSLNLPLGLTQTGGLTRLNGTANVGSGQTLALQGGILSGDGVITAPAGTTAVTNTGGTVSPGNDAPGQFSLNGNFVQGAGGALLIELSGATPVSQFDFFDVNGAVNLNGSVQVSLLNGFSPALNDTFRFLEFNAGARTGQFAGPVKLDPAFPFDYQLSYDNMGAYITVVLIPEPSTCALLGAGLLAGLVARRRQGR